jgi:hypothetical protein
MSQLGQTRKSAFVTAMSAFPPIATTLPTSREVRFGPNPEVAFYSITLSARATNPAGISRSSSFAALRLMTSSQWVS